MGALQKRSSLEARNDQDVVAAEPRATYNLIGHSGAQVVLHSKGADSFVRKSASTPAASARLVAQADKQHAFWMLGLPFPKVRSQTTQAGVASFEMNYIPGRTIADAVVNGGVFDTGTVVKAVDRLMSLFVLGSKGVLPASFFRDKIRDVAARAAQGVDDSALRNSLRHGAELLLDRDWGGIPQSPCHGDLTLENILLTTGKSIAFIDCDAPFASSYWLDFGKLFQDVQGHWCLRSLYESQGSRVRLINAIQKLEALEAALGQLASSLDNRLLASLPQLGALGLYRAIPYARNSSLISFLCRRIEHVLRK